MPDERVLFAILVRVVLLAAAVVNLALALREYRRFGDARGLRGFVAGIGFLAGALALTGSSEILRNAIPGSAFWLMELTVAGIFVFVACLLFSVYTWRGGRDASGRDRVVRRLGRGGPRA